MEGQAAQSKMNESAQQQNQQPTSSGPENSSQINVSVKKNPNFYVFLGKRYLEIHETIELHALGNAVSTSVIASENLVRNKYAEFKSIRTMTIPVSSKSQSQNQRAESSKKAKLLITLKRSKDFFENMRRFSEIKEENERLAANMASKNQDGADTAKAEEKKQ